MIDAVIEKVTPIAKVLLRPTFEDTARVLAEVMMEQM